MSRRRGLSDGVVKVLDHAEKLGWTYEKTPGGHYKMTKQGCPCVFFSATPSDSRAWRNGIAKLNRADQGVDSESKIV